MRYLSTRDSNTFYTDIDAILNDTAKDEGVFVPETFPQFTESDWEYFARMPLYEKFSYVFSKFITSLPEEEIKKACKKAVSNMQFEESYLRFNDLNEYSDYPYSFELWHGPGASYHDLIATLVPALYKLAHDRNADRIGKKLLLVKASEAESAFAWTKGFTESGIEHLVFAADSEINKDKDKSDNKRKSNKRKKQKNKYNKKINLIKNYSDLDLFGNTVIDQGIDDLDRALDELLQNEEYLEQINSKGYSIQVIRDYSWPVLLVQIAYFCILHAEVLNNEKFVANEIYDLVVPSSDLSNVLAALYAKACGTRVASIIVAANKNNFLTELIRTGRYNMNKKVQNTNSPMLNRFCPENLERLLYEFSQRDAEKITSWYSDLNDSGIFKLDKNTLSNMNYLLNYGYADDAHTRQGLINAYNQYDHIFDPNTAVGLAVHSRLEKNSNNKRKTIYVSLTSPYMYPVIVAEAILGEDLDFADVDELRARVFIESDLNIPARYPLAQAKASLIAAEIEADEDKKKFYGEQEFLAGDKEAREILINEIKEAEAEELELAKRQAELAAANLEKIKLEIKDLELGNKHGLDELADLILEKIG